jgi:glycosyltransferase involved in cell wall biosynthesis
MCILGIFLSNTKHILYLISRESYFRSHRLALAREALAKGYRVSVCTVFQSHDSVLDLRHEGFHMIPLASSAGFFVIKVFKTWLELMGLFRRIRPDLVHTVALPLTLLGRIAAKRCAVPAVFSTLGGLGYAFTLDSNLSAWTRCQKACFRGLARLGFWMGNHPNAVLSVQNTADQNALYPMKCLLIQGSGVDIHTYIPRPFPPSPPIIVLCVTRLLREKGLFELAEAARILKHKAPTIKVILMGAVDAGNPSTLSVQQVLQWQEEGLLEWRGHCDTVAEAYAACHMAVLPSYREGMPKSLLEAASCGRPIVTTDVPGCRDVVIHGYNGLLVPMQDAVALAHAIETLAKDASMRQTFGASGRARVEAFFSDAIIQQKTFQRIAELLA